jgi:hypothetical protein
VITYQKKTPHSSPFPSHCYRGVTNGRTVLCNSESQELSELSTKRSKTGGQSLAQLGQEDGGIETLYVDSCPMGKKTDHKDIVPDCVKKERESKIDCKGRPVPERGCGGRLAKQLEVSATLT